MSKRKAADGAPAGATDKKQATAQGVSGEPTALAQSGGAGGQPLPVTTISYAWLKLYLIELVRQIGAKYGWEEKESLDTDIIWSNFRNVEWISALMRPGQRINHFPKMSACCEKGMTARLLNAQRVLFPSEYDFYPRSWEIRSDADLAAFKAEYDAKKTYIIKPVDESHGSNIVLAQSWEQITAQFCRDIAVQEYVANPLLIDGFKFDFRVYVLVRSVDPLHAYLFHDGLARLCTMPYHKPTADNLDKVYMHLTNYDLNKTNADFKIPDPTHESETGSKRALAVALKQIAAKHPSFSEAAFWQRLESVVSKTLLAFWPIVIGGYRAKFPQSPDMCFQLLGFDVLLDEHFNPYLLEVNQSPSIAAETALDMRLKQKLLETIFAILGYLPADPSAQRALEASAKAKTAARPPPPPRPAPKAGDPPHFDVAPGPQQFRYGQLRPTDSDAPDNPGGGWRRLQVSGAANPSFFAAFERFRTAGAEGLTRDQFLQLLAAYGVTAPAAAGAAAAATAGGAEGQGVAFPVLSAKAAGEMFDTAMLTLTDRLARAPAIDKDKEKRKKDELAAAKKSVITAAAAAAATGAGAAAAAPKPGTHAAAAAAAAPAPALESNSLTAFIQKLGDAQEAAAAPPSAAAAALAAASASASAGAGAGADARAAFATPKDYALHLYAKHFGRPAPSQAAAATGDAAAAGAGAGAGAGPSGFEFHLSKTIHGVSGTVMPFVLFGETLMRYTATSATAKPADAPLKGAALVQRFHQLCARWAALHK